MYAVVFFTLGLVVCNPVQRGNHHVDDAQQRQNFQDAAADHAALLTALTNLLAFCLGLLPASVSILWQLWQRMATKKG
jgi:hypothetical protein